MNYLTTLALVFLTLVALPFASAYSFSMPTSRDSGFEGYGYGYIPPYQNFNMYDNTNRFNQDYSLDSTSSGSLSYLTDQNQQSLFDSLVFGERSSTQSLLNSFASNGDLALSDGYDLSKGSCSNRRVRGILPSSSGDPQRFRILERTCDGISGTLWRDNSLTSDYQQQNSYNLFGTQNDVNQQTFNNQNTQNNRYAVDNSYTQNQALTQQQSRTNIGRGAVIILN